MRDPYILTGMHHRKKVTNRYFSIRTRRQVTSCTISKTLISENNYISPGHNACLLKGGVCLNGLAGIRCSCRDGFSGPLCQSIQRECTTNPCLNQGSCIVRDGGRQKDYECRCRPGFVGTHCQDDVDDCLNRPCANGGTCQDLVNDFVCSCAAGFSGRFCSDNIDECGSNPCQQGALCLDRIDDFDCLCPPDFMGKTCELSVQQYHEERLRLEAEMALLLQQEEASRKASAALISSTASRQHPVTAPLVPVSISDAATVATAAVHQAPIATSGFPFQQMLIIACFGFAIPFLLLLIVLLIWVHFRKRRYDRSLPEDRCSLNNRRDEILSTDIGSRLATTSNRFDFSGYSRIHDPRLLDSQISQNSEKSVSDKCECSDLIRTGCNTALCDRKSNKNQSNRAINRPAVVLNIRQLDDQLDRPSMNFRSPDTTELKDPVGGSPLDNEVVSIDVSPVCPSHGRNESWPANQRSNNFRRSNNRCSYHRDGILATQV